MDNDHETEYFKEKLLSNFKEAGLLEHLKGQMRYNIVEKLQKRSLGKDANKENKNTLNQTKENTLNYRVLISLISEFLEFYGYSYTQAVFLPEAKHTSQTLSRSEIMELLHLSKVVGKEDPTPLLNKIVDFADRQLDMNKERMSVHCQTDFEGKNTNLEEKLRNVDYEYLQKIDGERLSSQQSFDEKFIKFKKDYEQRMKAEMAAEITRIKEFELANIKLEEAEKYRLKMEQYREELDRIYTEKLQKLRERERDTIERCKQQFKTLEAASYDYRQKFLKDLEVQKIKEEGLDSHISHEKENLRLQKERLQELERDLQRQFKDLEDQRKANATATIKRIDEHKVTTSYKAEVSREAEEDRLAVLHMKAKLENETSKVEQLKNAAENYEGQNKRLLEENAQVMEEVRRLREIKKNQEFELDKTKETLQVVKKSLEKDEDHIKLYDKQIQEYQEEIKNHKGAIQEYKEMIQQRKREQIDSNQKFIKEIEFYQNEIEKAEKERDAHKRRTIELENEIKTLTINPPQMAQMVQMTETVPLKESFEASSRHTHEPKRESHRQAPHHDTTSRYRNTVIMEEDEEEPARRLEDIDRELRELKEKRENVLFGYGSSSGEKRHLKAHSSSPRFERERHPKRHEEVQFSPQFNPYLEQSSTDLKSLERKKQELKNELKDMIGLNDSRRSHQDTFSVGLNSEAKKAPYRDNFDHITDRYTDKILKDLHSFDNSYDKSPIGEKNHATKGKMNYEEFAPSEKKSASAKNEILPKKNEQYSGVKDIFKVESPVKTHQAQKIDYQAKHDSFEDSQKSNKSLLDSFHEDNNPKPIVFTKKEPLKKESEKAPLALPKETLKPITQTKAPLETKKEEKKVKDELPSSFGSKNLPGLDKPKLGELNPLKSNAAAPLTLPTGFGSKKDDLKTKPKEEPKKDNKKSALDFLGDHRKTTEEIDFEEIDEELFEF